MDSVSWSAEKILVVGGDSLIGGVLTAFAANAKAEVIATTRRPSQVSETRPRLDLSEDLSVWRAPGPVTIAFLCAAVNETGSVQSDPAGAWRVNVGQTIALAEYLHREGAFVVFFSSDHVFDGSRAFRKASDEPCPVTEYGKQKFEAEKGVLALGKNACVIRLTKIVGYRQPLFVRWALELRQGRPIEPFADKYFAPIYIDDIPKTVYAIAGRKQTGIFQLSAAWDLSYAQAASLIADELSASGELVRPCMGRERGVAEMFLRPHGALDTSCARQAIGFVPPDPEDAVRKAIASIVKTGV